MVSFLTEHPICPREVTQEVSVTAGSVYGRIRALLVLQPHFVMRAAEGLEPVRPPGDLGEVCGLFKIVRCPRAIA
jgi:hypothetical protein